MRNQYDTEWNLEQQAGELVVAQDRITVDDLASMLREAAEQIDQQQVTAVLAKVKDLPPLGSVRSIEVLATKLGSTSQSALPFFGVLADDDSLNLGQRVIAGLIAAVGWRRGAQAGASERHLARLSELYESSPELREVWPSLPALIFHLRAVNCIGGSTETLRVGIELSRKANQMIPDSPGFLHALAHLLLEQSIWEDLDDAERATVLQDALLNVERALIFEKWPKFHFTRGRILIRLGGDMGEALEELRRAASENSGSFDSERRSIQYALEVSLAEIRDVLSRGQVSLDERLRRNERLLEQKTKSASQELEVKILTESRAAQNQAIMIVGFVTVALAMLPLATSMFGFIESIGVLMAIVGVGSFAAILWGAVAFATWNLNRGMRKSLETIRQITVTNVAQNDTSMIEGRWGEDNRWEVVVVDVPFSGKDHDAWAASSSSVAVVDGATPLASDWPQDLKQFATSIARQLTRETDVPMTQVWREAIVSLRERFEPAGYRRSAGAALVRDEGGRVELGVLGDIRCLVTVNHTVYELIDHRLSELDNRAKAIGTMQVLMENRATANTPDGYPIFADDPTASDRLTYASFDRGSVSSIALMSDGAWRVLPSSPEEALSLLAKLGPAKAIEDSKVPLTDDATIVYLRENDAVSGRHSVTPQRGDS